MISLLFAASLSFSATATGVEKGTPVEFLFAGKNSDRDYETMFLLDEPVDALCARLEKAGLPRGKAVSLASCTLWPEGRRVSFKPSFSEFVESAWPNGLPAADFIYTGGSRSTNGLLLAAADMPCAFCSLYSLEQSPIVFNGNYPQGDVYGVHKAKLTLKKGERRTFTICWDDSSVVSVRRVSFKPGEAQRTLLELKDAAKTAELVVEADFDPSLTVRESIPIAQALAVIDSTRIKINGCPKGRLFYRSFLPSVSWTDRQQRLTQPFELTIQHRDSPKGLTKDFDLVFIEEDWSVAGNDPKLTPKKISFAEAAKHPKTDTCFIYCSPDTRLEIVYDAMSKMPSRQIRNWYLLERK